jgi:hypothetical protein
LLNVLQYASAKIHLAPRRERFLLVLATKKRAKVESESNREYPRVLSEVNSTVGTPIHPGPLRRSSVKNVNVFDLIAP